MLPASTGLPRNCFVPQALRFPIQTLLDAFAWWRRNGARLRRARILCQCADSLRLRRARGFELRTPGLYRRALRSLEGLADGNQESDLARAAHRAVWIARRPYRAAWLAGLAVALGLVLAGFLTLAAGSLVSINLRARFFPRDLAAGQPWKASSADVGYQPNGKGTSADGPAFFHTTYSNRPWVEIDLGGEHVISGFLIENRKDCCAERALPLNFEAWDGHDWKLVAQRHSPFSTWSADTPLVRSQKVRILRPGDSFLHLRRVSVYGR
jgi:hypothetical protein